VTFITFGFCVIDRSLTVAFAASNCPNAMQIVMVCQLESAGWDVFVVCFMGHCLCLWVKSQILQVYFLVSFFYFRPEPHKNKILTYTYIPDLIMFCISLVEYHGQYRESRVEVLFRLFVTIRHHLKNMEYTIYEHIHRKCVLQFHQQMCNLHHALNVHYFRMKICKNYRHKVFVN
jgi:hypothetical protein